MGNALMTNFESGTTEEPNPVKFKRRPGISSNWPPADWKTAPGFPTTGAPKYKPIKDISGLHTLKEDEVAEVMRHLEKPVDINFEGVIQHQVHLGWWVYKILKSGFVKWVNETMESGLPYDLVVGDKEYIEVKSTKYVRKDWFSISIREWQFAVKLKRVNYIYSIAHVVLAADNTATVSQSLYTKTLPDSSSLIGKLQLALTIH
ncbi:unnamed protein product [Cuscuta epithymum]|uniref:Protein NO VEIN C-terminal domain-containing protein n=1 Tax=Cuscuta epithymum TaxID=186058 RepID=A0AAV0BXE8_9ASTE|nr:unnamed protein product [Cuscuta epithymum]